MGEKGNLEPATVMAVAGPGVAEQVGGVAQAGGAKVVDAAATQAAAAVVTGAVGAVKGKDDEAEQGDEDASDT